MSDELCMVVEQLICPPRKKATLPFGLNKGARVRVSFMSRKAGSQEIVVGRTGIEQIPEWLPILLVV